MPSALIILEQQREFANLCSDRQSVEKKCVERMKDKDVRRMLVLDANKRLVGVVSLGDISKALEELAAEALKDIAEAA